MIEVYSFLAAFTLQILTISLLVPARFRRRIRAELACIPAEQLAELYPDVDVGEAYERFLARYRVANLVIVALGLLLLGWFVRVMQHPNWDEGEGAVSGMVTVYFMLQYCPIMWSGWFVARFNKVHRRSLPGSKRKAVLQPRGLFDFVAPLTVILAVLAYLQFVAFVFYIARHPFPGFAGPFVNIGIVTLMYVLFAFVVYWVMYVRKRGPLETHANRMRLIGIVVNAYAGMCILVPLLLSLTFARKLLDLEAWSPFGRSAAFLIMTLVVLRLWRSSEPPRPPEAHGLGSSPAH